MASRSDRGRERSARIAERYRDALKRLVTGRSGTKTRNGSEIRISPASVAAEAGLSRNPLYTTHRDILLEIKQYSPQRSKHRPPRSVDQLRAEIEALRTQLRQQVSENATLLYRALQAEKQLGRGAVAIKPRPERRR
jgi:hypothetical protein